ncbi:hypothetical protein AUJ46_05765 [Candidatus Peregrinibacteria bacterium CG1_02_54_53]|nr:MAG: hypothetical protein AUJ46_05765 [Candidatus Peregrinibacteria bacterium CG1_02_54_53]
MFFAHPEDRGFHYRELSPSGQIDQRNSRCDSREVTLRLERRKIIRASPFGQNYAFTHVYFLGSDVVALEAVGGFRLCVGQFLRIEDHYEEFLPGDIIEIRSIQIDHRAGTASLVVTVDTPIEPNTAGRGLSLRHLPLDFTLFQVMQNPGHIPATKTGSAEYSPRQLRDRVLPRVGYNEDELTYMIQNEQVIPAIAAAVQKLLERVSPDLSAARISASMQQTKEGLERVLYSSAGASFRQLFMHWLEAEAGARGISIKQVLSAEDQSRFPHVQTAVGPETLVPGSPGG